MDAQTFDVTCYNDVSDFGTVYWAYPTKYSCLLHSDVLCWANCAVEPGMLGLDLRAVRFLTLRHQDLRNSSRAFPFGAYYPYSLGVYRPS